MGYGKICHTTFCVLQISHHKQLTRHRYFPTCHSILRNPGMRRAIQEVRRFPQTFPITGRMSHMVFVSISSSIKGRKFSGIRTMLFGIIIRYVN
eukprot:g12081.t1